VGLYTQPPQSFDLEPAPLGNPNLGHVRAFQSSLGIAQHITENINIDLTGFFNRRYEYVVTPGNTVVNADGSITQERSANAGLGRAYGLEVLLRHEVSKYFFGWIAYTFSRSEDSRNGADGYWLNTYDQTHNLIIVGSFRIPLFCSREVACGGWEIGGRFRYVTGRPTSPLVHPYDLYRNDDNSFATQRGDFRSARFRAFNQLDIRIDKNFVFDKWTFGLYLDVQNVYNAKNVEGVFTDYRGRQEFDVPGIPFLPIFGIRGSM
jgi:hypothetical protein